MIQKIVQSGDPILRKKSRPIHGLDKKTLKLITDLKDTLGAQKEPEGVGLAAPQIGKNLQVFVCSYKKFQRVVINPKIIDIDRSPTKSHQSSKSRGREILEGCLSLPYYYGPLKRSKSVTLEYTNKDGKRLEETFKGFDAQIILHEIDHLNGILFIDKLLKENKPLYKIEGDTWEEVEI